MRAEDRGRIDESLAEFDASIRREGDDVREALESLAAAIAADRSRPAPGQPGMRDYAGRLLEISGLDCLVILDPAGITLSSGQAPGRAGQVDPVKRDLGGAAASIVEDAIDPGVGRALTLQARQALPAYGPGTQLVGGRLLDAGFLQRLSPGGAVKALLLDRDGGIVAASRPDDPLPAPAEVAARLRRAGEGGADQSIGEIADRGVAFSYRARLLRTADGMVLGALVAAVSLERFERLSGSLGRAALGVMAVGGVTSLLVGLALARGVTRPLRRLEEMTGRIARDRYEPVPEVDGPGEVGDLVRAFNRMAEALRDSRERLRLAERRSAAEEVARRVAHEIRNPLAPIALTLEGLRRTREVRPAEFDAAFEAAIETIQEEIRRMRRVLDDFSRFGRLPAPQPRLTDLNRLVESVLRLYRDDRSAVRIVAELDPGLPPLPIDPDLFGEVINNLVGNALQAVGDSPGVVTVTTRSAGGAAEMAVHDSGPGLSDEARLRLFEPYFSTRPGGTGLGLSIARRIVLDHGGAIEADNDPGGGARILVRLPIAGAASPEADPAAWPRS